MQALNVSALRLPVNIGTLGYAILSLVLLVFKLETQYAHVLLTLFASKLVQKLMILARRSLILN